jgi:pyruvate dehydrogenase E1 component beta subunit
MARELKYLNAINEALLEEMERDERVVIIGEDVRAGAFGYTWGLRDKFGDERVIDTPISESGFCGMASGAAMHGLRPVVDLKLASFMYVAMDQILNEAAKIRYMSGGQATLPVVFLCRSGAAGGNGAQHSDNPYPIFMQSPGLKIALPADAHDVKGLLKTAIRDDDPVAFFASVRGMAGPVPEGEHTIPFGQALVRRKGRDVTIIATMHLVFDALKVAEELEADGISVEVVDPRTIVPLDKAAILDSIAKTGRGVIADDAPRACGFAAEVAALIAEEGFASLKAPIKRVTRLNIPIPFSRPLEDTVLPDRAKIRAAVREVLG